MFRRAFALSPSFGVGCGGYCQLDNAGTFLLAGKLRIALSGRLNLK